jgi:hypothetical protein
MKKGIRQRHRNSEEKSDLILEIQSLKRHIKIHLKAFVVDWIKLKMR